MSSLIDLLKSNRPKLTDSSLRSYSSVIQSLYRKMNHQMNGNPTEVSTFFFDNHEKVFEFLKDYTPNRRKTILAALVVLCIGKKCVDEYRSRMLLDSDVYNKEQREQKKTTIQSENWISQDEVMEVYKNLQRLTSKLWKKNPLTKVELIQLQDFVILSLYVLIAPRRLMDYTHFKIRNINKNVDNYMENRQFIFNKYKTANIYSKQVVDIPIKLKTIVDNWTDKNPENEYLLTQNGKPFPQPLLTMRLNIIFGGRKISVNQLRHTFITDNVLKNVPALTKLEDIAQNMGNSLESQMLYKKL